MPISPTHSGHCRRRTRRFPVPEGLEEAIDRWGSDRQMIKCCEEMGELTQAICKRFDRGPGTDDAFEVEAIVEEMVDVEIMLEQLRLILKVDPAMEQRWLERKLRRLMVRLGG